MTRELAVKLVNGDFSAQVSYCQQKGCSLTDLHIFLQLNRKAIIDSWPLNLIFDKNGNYIRCY